MGSPRRRPPAALVLAVSLAAIGVVACSDSGSSTGSTTAPGNTVVNDTRDAEPRPPANPDPGDGSTPTGEPDASGYGDGGAGSDAPASYPGVTACSACACPSASAYCFGGATPRDPMRVIPLAADAGPACPLVTAGTVGCTALPAGATTCTDLLAALQPTYACYLVCAFDGKQMTVYCPSP